MKKNTLLIIFAFLVFSLGNAQVIIGSQNLEDGQIPFDPYFGYSYTQSVYTASEINASGTITGLQWYYSGTSALDNSQELVIYLAESTRTDYADTDDWEPIANFTQVYSGGITVTAGTPGWTQIVFDTPFVYTGTDNLIIAVEDNMVGYDGFADDFYNSEVAGDRSIFYRSDTTNPDPAAPPTANDIANRITNVTLDGIMQSCPNPANLAASAITSTSAELSWTQEAPASLWNVEVVESGAVPTGTPTYSGVTNPYTVNNLMPITGYDVYVQADCTSELSGWAGPVSFTTECAVIIPDYIQDFATIPADCWEEADSGDGTTGPMEVGAGSWVDDGFLNNGFTGAFKINLYLASKSDWIISPQFDLTGGPFQVEFDFGVMNFASSTNPGALGSDDTVEFFMTTDSGTTWTSLLLWDNTSVFTASGEHPVVDLTAYSGQTVQFAILGSEGTVNDPEDVDVFVDNFRVRAIPTCQEPTDLVVGTVTDTTAELSWTENGGQTLWNIEVVESGTAPTGIPTNSGVTNPYTVNNLTEITSYDFYVQTDCGSEVSSWSGPVSFTTECGVFTPDYLQDFTTIPADCWQEADSGDATTGPMELGGGSWGNDGFLNDGFTGAYKINLFLATKSDWIISPQFDLTGGPFQVEFDFGVMNFGSSTNPGTLGSDDTVEFFVTTDSGTTWTSLLLWDSTSVFTASGEHPVVDLTTYSGQTVQFAILGSEGTVDDTEDIDVFVDNFRVRAIPTCQEPTDLNATNVTLTSTEISWTENGTSTLWNIEYGEEGFVQGSGTIISDVMSNPYTLTGLTDNTSYQFYVQTNCGTEGLSSWTGPFTFVTGYCESVPTSNDGDGVTNVTLVNTDFPSFGDVTYEDHTATTVTVFQGIDTNLEITFATGFTYDTNVWIDFNNDLVFDDTELVFDGESAGGNPTTLDATFTMPATAAIGEHRMRIGTADFGQGIPNPCYSGAWGVTLDFTVNVQELECTLPEADFSIAPDCDSDQFFVEVNITSLGDATVLNITNTYNSDLQPVTAPGVYQVGPVPFNQNIKVYVASVQNSDCTISSPTYILAACPPVNDSPCDATVAGVNEGETCDIVTPGTLFEATDSGIPYLNCSGNPNDDVWFEFTALGEQQIIDIQNGFGIDHAVYSGTCDNLVELYCSDDDNSVTPTLTIGDTYFIRVFSGSANPQTTTFDLCIQTLGDPTYCSEALPICPGLPDPFPSVSDGSTAPPYLDYGCLFSQPNPYWNTINVNLAGDYNFTLQQTSDSGNLIDIDFIVWGPFTDLDDGCYDLLPENIADCSYSATATETIELTGAPANSIYVLLITNFSGQPGSYTFEQESGPENGINCDVVCTPVLDYDGVEIVEGETTPEGQSDSIVFCDVDSITLTATTVYNVDTYDWFLDGIYIDGVTTNTLEVTESGQYFVTVGGSLCADYVDSLTANIYMYDSGMANQAPDLVACDDESGDGVEEFDLESQTATILGTQNASDFLVTYYASIEDAEAGTNALTSPYSAVDGTVIYVRVEDVDAVGSDSGCVTIDTTFNLLISGVLPTAEANQNMNLCDENNTGDETEDFDLESNSANILGTQSASDYTVTYYLTEADADAAINALSSPYTNISNPQTVYARVENNISSSCYTTTSFDLTVDKMPSVSFASDLNYEVCPNATTPITITADLENSTSSDVSIVWMYNGSVITGQTGLELATVLNAGTYTIEVTNASNMSCSSIAEVEVIELETCVIPQGISPNNDDKNDSFDLRAFDVQSLEIYNRYGRLVYSKTNYTNEWSGQSKDGDELPVGTYYYVMKYQGNKVKAAWVYINREQ